MAILDTDDIKLLNGDGYKGDPRLRRAHLKLDYTAEQALELLKCYENPIYFISTYCKMVTLDHGLQAFIPRPYQERTIKTIAEERFVTLKWGRQSGKTATTAAVLTWLLIFNKEYTIGVLAHKQDQSIEILDRIKIYYSNLPLWIQHGVVTWNRKSIELENGSEVFAAATGSGTVRGRTLNCVYADEFALVQDALSFWEGVFPTISSGSESKFIVSSTPKGYNLFWKIWKEAEEGTNGFIPIAINYWDVPGRTEEWAASERKRMGEAQFRQEYEASFEGSSNSLVDGKKIAALTYTKPIQMDPLEQLHIFYTPEAGRKYILAADVSEGVGGDYSTFSVLDVTNVPYRVVATYANDMITTLMFPNIIYDVAQAYNQAFVIIEANTIGAEVCNILYYDLEYENIISSNAKQPKNKLIKNDVSENPRTFLGIKTTKKTKHLGCSNLKMLVEGDQLTINDYRIIYELSRFVKKGTSYAAEDGEHDDLVMSLVSFAWFTTQPLFVEMSGTNIRVDANQRNLYQQDNMPIGFIYVDHSRGQFEAEDDFITMSDFDKWMIE